MKATTPLQRGKACLCCRKRKMKCDGQHPICGQCIKANRDSECQYYEKKQTSRTELLRAKVAKLEARLRELESDDLSGPPVLSPSMSSPEVPSPLVPFDLSPMSRPGTSSSSLALGVDPDDYSSSVLLTSPESIFDFSSLSATPSDLWMSDYFDSSLYFDSSFPMADSASSSTVSSPQVGPPAAGWWGDSTSYCGGNKRKLLDIFLAHRHQCGFDVHVGRLEASLALPPPQQPHPALLDAMCLMGCFFSQNPQLASLEAYFLQRALTAISTSLERNDRLLQVIQASCLLAIYFFSRGRQVEGYYHSSTATRLAISLGLHQIKPDDWYKTQLNITGRQPVLPLLSKSVLKLSPPRDAVEHCERVATFWQVYTIDCAWSVASGLPGALPDEARRAQVEITWPSAICDSVGQPGSAYTWSYDASKLNPSFRAKAVAFYDRTYRIASSSYQNDDRYWTEHRYLDMALTQMAASLPAAESPLPQDTRSQTDLQLITIHTIVQCSIINLHRAFLETQPLSYQKCILAANSVISMVRELVDSDYDLLDPILSSCWKTVAHIYIRALVMQQMQALPSIIQVVEHKLDTLVNAMKTLGKLFPSAYLDAEKTESSWAIIPLPC